MNGILFIIVQNNEIKKKCNGCNKIWDLKTLELCPICIPDKCNNCLWKNDTNGLIKRIFVCNNCTNVLSI